MTKQSFIGDMWKAAVEIRSFYEASEDFCDVEITKNYIDKKFAYLLIEQDNNVNNCEMCIFGTVALLNAASVCKNIEKNFAVKCSYFIYKQKCIVFQGFVIK